MNKNKDHEIIKTNTLFVRECENTCETGCHEAFENILCAAERMAAEIERLNMQKPGFSIQLTEAEFESLKQQPKTMIDEMNTAVAEFYAACDKVVKIMARHRLELEERSKTDEKTNL